MLGLYPTRRFLGVPAWLWLVPPLGLGLLAKWLGPPPLSPLPEAPEIFKHFVPAVTPDGDSYHCVPNEERDSVKPLWNIGKTTAESTTVTWKLGWDHEGLHLGFYKKSTRRSYGLWAFQSDREPGLQRAPAEEVERIRRFVIDEMNRRWPQERLGSRLEAVLQNGTQQTSYWCVQNVVILMTWLTLLVALVAASAMFIRPRRVVDQGLRKPGATGVGCDDPEFPA